MENRDATNLLLRQLEKLSNQSVDIEPLLRRATAKLNKLLSQGSASNQLRDDILQIMQFLSSKADQSIPAFKIRTLQKLATAALLYCTDEGERVSFDLSTSAYADYEWVAGFVNGEINAVTRQENISSGQPKLNEALKKEAELKLFELASALPSNIEKLLSEAKNKTEKLKQFASIGFIHSLIQNSLFLQHLINEYLKQENLNTNEYCFRMAIGAIRYLNERYDLIPDANGIIGFLDDSFVLDMAAQLVKKHKNNL